jgi:hypothetical protein
MRPREMGYDAQLTALRAENQKIEIEVATLPSLNGGEGEKYTEVKVSLDGKES